MLLYLVAAVFAALPWRAGLEPSVDFGIGCCGYPIGPVPKCPENACKWPYNQKLEGSGPLFPQSTADEPYVGVRMKERGWIEPIVERVVGQVLDSHAAQLRTEIVHRVMEEIAAAPAIGETTSDSTTAASASGPADLARAVAEIQLGS